MSKDDPTFNIKEELRAQSNDEAPKMSFQTMTDEDRESIVMRTMHALSVSEQFTELLVKRMEQNDSLRKQEPPSVPTTTTKKTKGGRKRKLQDSPSEVQNEKMRKGSDGSAEPVDHKYLNAQNLSVSSRQPKLLEGAVMRDYQLDGLDWLVALDLNGANGILADEMGLGKTLQVIALVCFLVEMGVGSEAPFLIIGPLSTLHNWKAEFEKFAPKIPVILFHGSKDERASLKMDILKKKTVNQVLTYPVIITSFEVPLRDASLRKINWRYLIIDEGHRLKNHKCLLFKELRRYRSTNRLLLTGTPLQNNMTELWSLLNFVLPNIVTDMDVFECWFDPTFLEASDASEKIVQAEEENKVLSTIHKILKPFVLRRVKADVALHIPPKKEIIVYAQMSKWQNRLYSAVVNKTLYSLQGRQPDMSDPSAIMKAHPHESKTAVVDEGPRPVRRLRCRNLVKSGDYSLLARGIPLNAIREEPLFCEEDSSSVDVKTDKLLEGLIDSDEEFVTEIKMTNPVAALRQICNHPYLASFPVIPGTRILKTDENVVQRSGKMQILDALLKRLKNNGHKVLIFSNFTRMLDIIEDYLELRNYQYTRLDGSCDLANRKISIEKFNTDDDVFIFLISTRAGGLGINLVAADTVIIYDSDWNPQVDLQAQDRCHRIGQTKPVVVYRFVVRGTMDEHILQRAETKKQLDKLVIQHGKFKNVKKNEMVSLEELRELLECKDKNEVVMDNGLVYTDRELDELCDRTAVFTSQKNKEKTQNGEAQDAGPIIEDLRDIDTTSESSDSQDGMSLISHASSEASSVASHSSESSTLSSDSGCSLQFKE